MAGKHTNRLKGGGDAGPDIGRLTPDTLAHYQSALDLTKRVLSDTDLAGYDQHLARHLTGSTETINPEIHPRTRLLNMLGSDKTLNQLSAAAVQGKPSAPISRKAFLAKNEQIVHEITDLQHAIDLRIGEILTQNQLMLSGEPLREIQQLNTSRADLIDPKGTIETICKGVEKRNPDFFTPERSPQK